MDINIKIWIHKYGFEFMCKEKKSLWSDMRGIKCLTYVGNRALETMVNNIPICSSTIQKYAVTDQSESSIQESHKNYT